ncbi:MAG: HD domain-containing protein [Mycobacterium sp.]
MPNETDSPRLTARFADALTYAADLHKTQVRKGGDIPYIGHLLSVAALVIEAGGTETQAIAALLHDAVEDQGGADTLAEIESRFGQGVAGIVGDCSDTDEDPKPPWRSRKESYIEHLADVSTETILVSAADKLDNARAILRDLRNEGPSLWERFTEKDPGEHLWYYRALAERYESAGDNWVFDELKRTIVLIEREIVGNAARKQDSPATAVRPL